MNIYPLTSCEGRAMHIMHMRISKFIISRTYGNNPQTNEERVAMWRSMYGKHTDGQFCSKYPETKE